MDPLVESLRPRGEQEVYSVGRRCLEEAAVLADELR